MAVCASILPHLGSLFFAFVLPMYCTLTLWYQQLYDALLKTFTPKEQWFVEYHYNQRYTLIALTQLDDSPFKDYDRTTVWKYKKRLLSKADAILQAI